MTRVWRVLSAGEKGLSIAAISLMSLLPCIAMVTRLAGTAGISGSVVFVQQLTLCVAFLGAALAASGDRLLSMSANTFLPEKWVGPCAFSPAASLRPSPPHFAGQLPVRRFRKKRRKRTGPRNQDLDPRAVMPFGSSAGGHPRHSGRRSARAAAPGRRRIPPGSLDSRIGGKAGRECRLVDRHPVVLAGAVLVCRSSPLWAASRCCCSGVADNPPPSCG